jgi:hypothetical protein
VIHVPERVKQAVSKAGEFAEPWLQFFRRIGRTYGTWTDVPYAAATYSASGSMTWTVQEADQTTLAYTLMGKRAEVAFVISAAAVGGVVGTTLRIAIPGKDENGTALVAARDMTAPVWVNDNGTHAIGVARVTAGSSLIQIQKVNGANWTAGANGVEGQIALEVR